MSPLMITLLAILGLIVVLLVWGIAIYNQLINLKNRFVNAFSQIDVQLQRRYDLIPNLVETAKGYMKYEQETLTKVIQTRNVAQQAKTATAKNPSDPKSMEQLIQAEKQLTASMTHLFALAENYPDLKANETMKNVMEELSSTENKVAFARQAYNDAVMGFNTYKDQFPNNIVSGIFNYKAAVFFEIEESEAKKPVKVSFT